MEVPLLPLVLLALFAAYSVAFVYLAWFKPDLFRKLRQLRGPVRKMLHRGSDTPWQEEEFGCGLWGTRLVGPVVAALAIALLIAMLVYILRQ